MLWGEEGLDLEKGHSNDFEAALSMVQRTDGSYVFAWEKDYGDQICIQMECISKDKEFLWEESVYLKEDNVGILILISRMQATIKSYLYMLRERTKILWLVK